MLERGYSGVVTPNNYIEQFNSGVWGNDSDGEECLSLQRVYADVERALVYSNTELQAIIDFIKC